MSKPDLYSYGYSIVLSAKKLTQDYLDSVESIDIKDTCDGSNTCTVVLNDINFDYIEDDLFKENADIDIYLGFTSDTYYRVFSGFISVIDINFTERGFPNITLNCMDQTHAMNRKKKSRSWENMSSAQVVETIAKEYGFKCIAEQYEYSQEAVITQDKMTDIDFCESLAEKEKEPFMCKLVGDTIYYIRRGLITPAKYYFHYNEPPFDVISFSPRLRTEIREEEVEEGDIKTENKETETSTQAVGNMYEYNTVDDTWRNV